MNNKSIEKLTWWLCCYNNIIIWIFIRRLCISNPVSEVIMKENPLRTMLNGYSISSKQTISSHKQTISSHKQTISSSKQTILSSKQFHLANKQFHLTKKQCHLANKQFHLTHKQCHQANKQFHLTNKYSLIYILCNHVKILN